MKPANFPARKLHRQLIVRGGEAFIDVHADDLDEARRVRSKKDRSLRGRRQK